MGDIVKILDDDSAFAMVCPECKTILIILMQNITNPYQCELYCDDCGRRIPATVTI